VLGLTFYQAIDYEPEAVKTGLHVCYEGGLGGGRAGGESCGRNPKRQAMARRRLLPSVLWHVDAGLVASTPGWRKGLKALICRAASGTGGAAGVGSTTGGVGGAAGYAVADNAVADKAEAGYAEAGYSVAGYAEHAHAYHEQVGLASSHSDELALHEFLLEGRCMTRSVAPSSLDSSRGHTSMPHGRPHGQLPPQEPSQPPPPPAAETWLTEGSELLHKRLARRFGKTVMLGTVVGWLPANENEGDEALYRVHHDDGDVEDLDGYELSEAFRLYEEREGRRWMRDYVRTSAVLRSHVLTCRSQARALPLLSRELREFLGVSAPCYTGLQLARAMGAPDEMTPEDVDEFGLRGSAYYRCVSESLQWARPVCGVSTHK